jgi:DSF synthase
MILSGEVYRAGDLYKLGAIDVLAPDGAASKPSTRISGEGGGGTPAIPRSGRPRRIANPVTREEMIRIADLWVESALTLTEAALRKTTRLAAPQDRRRNRGAAAI